MKRYIVALLAVLSSWTAHGQSVDSLMQRYKQESDPVMRRSLQLQLAWQYQTQGEFGKAIAYYKDVVSGEDSVSSGELTALQNLSFCYNELGDIASTIGIEKRILQIQKNEDQPYDVIEKSQQRLAALCLAIKDYKSAIAYNEEILRAAIEHKRYNSITQSYNNLGYIYYLIDQPSRSNEYFDKTYQALSESNFAINPEDKVTILLNLGIQNANMGRTKEAHDFLAEAYQISISLNDPVKTAHTLNYLASHEYIQGNNKGALRWAEEAIRKLNEAPAGDVRDLTLVQTYRIMAEVMFRKNDIASFRKYNSLYTQRQEEIIQKEKRRNRLFLERQIEVEKTKAEIASLLNEKEKQDLMLARTRSEQEARQKELQLKNTELEMLRKENELQDEKYRNTALQNQQMNQMLELAAQRSKTEQQQQHIVLLEKEKQLQDLQLEKKKKDIEQLQRSQEQDRQIRNYNFALTGLLVVLLIGAIWLYFYRGRKNRILLGQNETIKRMNDEITGQNQQLMAVNDELEIKSLELHAQHNKLNSAHQVINRQNEELLSYAKNLEGEVMRRTEQIREKSDRLAEYADQMEKFTYAISHNLRAPIARLLGLVNIISLDMPAAELAFFLSKVRESSVQLDDVIKDLSFILELKAEKHNDIEEIDLRARINSVLALHGDLIAEVAPGIVIDLQVKKIHGIGSLVDSILYNLIGNSLKFRHPDRELIIRLNSYQDGAYIVLRCEDNGIGIDLLKHGDKLFGLYKRFETKIEGKGLGLYLVKSHVSALNGDVTVESSPGKGTTFIIRLPSNQTIRTSEPRSENIFI